MQWAVGRLLAVPLWLFALFVAAYMFVLRIAEHIGVRLGFINSNGTGVDPAQLSLPMRLYLYAFRITRKLYLYAFRIARKIGHGPDKFRHEVGRISREAHKVAADIETFSAEQSIANPLNRDRKTIFLTITCGQAVRNFLLSDVLGLLTERYNVVILTPFAYSEEFRKAYGGARHSCAAMVHELPQRDRAAVPILFDAQERFEHASGLARQFGDQGQDGD